MSMRLHCGRCAMKKSMVDAQRDIALIKKVKLGIDPTRLSHKGLLSKLPSDPKVEQLVEELKRNIGTPVATDLRGQIVEVIAAARKEVAIKARAVSRRGGWGLKARAAAPAKKAIKGKW